MMPCRAFTYLLPSLLCLLTCASRALAASDSSTKRFLSVRGEQRPSRPYCGVYCLYTLLKATGLRIDFADLVKPEYIDSPRGSSLAALKRTAEDNGLFAECIGNMSIQDLYACPHPLILHVKPGDSSREYDHYQLFLGVLKDEKN